MKNEKGLKIILIIIGILIFLGILGNIVIYSFKDRVYDLDDSLTVKYFDVDEVKFGNITSVVKGTGEITSFNINTLDVPSYAKIKETFVNDGDMVTKNQRLFTINSYGYLSNVKATIDGMYFKVDNDAETLYQIYDLTSVGVEININEKDVASLSIGQKANVKITSLNKEVEGEVIYISKLPINGKFKVRIKIDYFDQLRFGYGVAISIVTSEKQDVMVIDYTALQMDENYKYYVVKENFAEHAKEAYNSDTLIKNEYRTYIEVGLITSGKVEVISGLSIGDKILKLDDAL